MLLGREICHPPIFIRIPTVQFDTSRIDAKAHKFLWQLTTSSAMKRDIGAGFDISVKVLREQAI